MIVTLKSITMRDTSCPLKRYPGRTITTHSILILDCHYLLAKIALVHVKIKAVHCYQLHKSYILSLLFVIR